MHRVDKFRIWYLAGLLVFGLSALQVQGQTVTHEDYQRAEQFLYQNVNELVFRTDVNPHWAEEQPKFWYRVDTRKGEEYFLVDAGEEKKQPFFDQKELARNLSEKVGEDIDPYDLPLNRLEWYPKEESLEFYYHDKRWKVDLETLDVYEFEEEEESPDWYEESQLSESPDGKWTVIRKDYNLWVKNNETGEEFQLTEDGHKEMIYGASQPWAWKKQEGPIEQEREDLWLNVSWSPNSQKLFAHKLDLRKAKLMYLLQYVPEESFRAQSVSYYRALPGDDSVAKQIPYVFEVEDKSRTRIQAGPYDDLIAGSWDCTETAVIRSI